MSNLCDFASLQLIQVLCDLCDCVGGIPTLSQSRLKLVCTLRFLAFCWLDCFPTYASHSFASRVATALTAVSSRLGLIVRPLQINFLFPVLGLASSCMWAGGPLLLLIFRTKFKVAGNLHFIRYSSEVEHPHNSQYSTYKTNQQYTMHLGSPLTVQKNTHKS